MEERDGGEEENKSGDVREERDENERRREENCERGSATEAERDGR